MRDRGAIGIPTLGNNVQAQCTPRGLDVILVQAQFASTPTRRENDAPGLATSTGATMVPMTDSPDSMNVIEWVAVGRRMQVARLAVGLSPARWSHLSGKILAFAQKFDVSLDWLLLGDASLVRRHLTKGNVAILPAKGPLARKAAPFEPAR